MSYGDIVVIQGDAARYCLKHAREKYGDAAIDAVVNNVPAETRQTIIMTPTGYRITPQHKDFDSLLRWYQQHSPTSIHQMMLPNPDYPYDSDGNLLYPLLEGQDDETLYNEYCDFPHPEKDGELCPNALDDEMIEREGCQCSLYLWRQTQLQEKLYVGSVTCVLEGDESLTETELLYCADDVSEEIMPSDATVVLTSQDRRLVGRKCWICDRQFVSQQEYDDPAHTLNLDAYQ